MPRRNRNSKSVTPDRGTAISLPVLGGDKRKIRRSKNGPRRAIVLAVVQVLIIAHVVQWLITGSTLSPIEPSEAMEFSKHGIVNAGLIFFILALLSTLLLGRWFCGWGCHVVLLQDLCGWMMKKVGIRPKPFRSRLLMWVPLLLGLYMFVWPAFYRFVILPWRDVQAQPWELQSQLTTTDFWATFPGLMVAIPFLLICGFATVYFLGAKGFCTYGCPYGGFFAPLDEYSPARIRVTDACEQCGHCTAVCTSNVRVHEEVREYGMVVDPGCMKCLDCVSVCPNDALYFGFGKTAAGKGKPKNKAPNRKFDLSMREEYAFAAVFAVVFFSFRGDYARFPLLMAAGVAMVLTWILWKAWRLTQDENANLHRYRLKLRGSLKPVGALLTLAAIVIALGVAHSGIVNAVNAVAGWHDGKVTMSLNELFDPQREQVDEAEQTHAQQGIIWYRRADMLAGANRTLSSAWREGIHMRMAWLHLVRGEFKEAEAALRTVLPGSSNDAHRNLTRSLSLVLAAQPDRVEDALTLYQDALLNPPMERPGLLLDDFMAWSQENERLADAFDVLQRRVQAVPGDSHAMRWLALMLLDRGEVAAGVQLLERAVQINSQDAVAAELLRTARQQGL